MKTANDLASAAETLALLDRLRAAARDAVTLAEQADREFQTRASRLRAQLEQAIEAERSRFATEMEAARAAAGNERNRLEAWFATRKTRLARAQTAARQRKLAEINAEESRHTFAIQRDLLEADREREAGAAANKARHEAMAARLARELADLEHLAAEARSTLAAYASLRNLPAAPAAPGEPPAGVSARPETELADALHAELDAAEAGLGRLRARALPLLFKLAPVWLWAVLIPGAAFAFVPALRRFDFAAVPPGWWAATAGGLALMAGLFVLGRKLAAGPARAVAQSLRNARMLHELAARKTEAAFAAETERIRAAHARSTATASQLWKRKQVEAKKLRDDWAERLVRRVRTLHSAAEGRRAHGLAQIEQRHAETARRLAAESNERKRAAEAAHAGGLAKLAASRNAVWQEAEQLWRETVLPVSARLRQTAEAARARFPAWQPELWRGFRLPDAFTQAARFAEVSVDLEALAGARLGHERLAPAAPRRFTLPLLLAAPDCASLLFETKQSGQEQVVGALNNLVLRLLTSAPPGRLEFTIFDPVGLGQNFAGLMHLADFEERLINGRIWTQQAQFEQRLADLNEHIEKVTQMYLRNEYASLAQYNARAGRMAEKYHFLVVADFPANFSDLAVRRLQNIAASGPRCGVHLLVHWDQRRAAPLEFVPDELRKNALVVAPRGGAFAIASCPAVESRADARPGEASDPAGPAPGAPLDAIHAWDGLKLSLDAPPDAGLATRLLHQIGRDSMGSNRVEMPFIEAAPGEGQFWTLDTTHELRVPIGRAGAAKLQYLALGKDTRQHALVAGKTGSGKSTLFHVIITNLALWCGPDQVEFYLVDFKKGVEFQCYAARKLPHARVIAIESDREFGLSVLQRVDEELKRRGDRFRKLGAQDLAGYKRAGGSEPAPRVLLLIDEFQELFVEDDRVSQGAALLLDRVVRQGRAFGIHVILGSQTLGGAYTLARATMGQMVVRIALQCNEADAHLIMNEDNAAPRLLSRPGEAIYNDDSGAVQGNSPFQVVWLPDRERDGWLEKIGQLAAAAPAEPKTEPPAGHWRRAAPVVFEGNAPADARENPLLRAALAAPAASAPDAARVWLGAPNSIKGPTEAVFRRASGSHLLIVGQREEAALAMLGVSLVSLAAQYPRQAARFLVFDCSAPETVETKFLEKVVSALPHEARIVRPGDVEEVMTALAEDQKRRGESPWGRAPETFLVVHGLHRNKKLRFDEEMSFSLDDRAATNPGLLFHKLVTEGAGLGFHVLATCDTCNNLTRMLSRRAVGEFEMRVVFQMSANDSATLIESPQANHLGLHRAIYFNGHEGWQETFRPYALPEAAWLAEAERALQSRPA